MVVRKKKKSTSSSDNHQDRVTRWAKEVVSGEFLAGPDIRNACKRHLKDLETGHERGLYFDLDAANRAISFFPKVLRLSGGDHEGKPFQLLDWQAFIVGSLFGWKDADNTRRFRMCYVESGKGSGKSPLAGGIGLYGLVADGEASAEVYAAATKKDQAMILFRDAVSMVNQSPQLSSRLKKSGTGQSVWNLAYIAKNSFFRPISSDNGQSGPRPHMALIDEVHEHKNNNVVEMMRAGTKGRKQALIFMITNSGHDRTSVCYSYHEYGKSICAGTKEDDSFFAFICSLDEGDDPINDESCWPKANPSLGHTFTHKYLREQVTQAKGMPAKESIVRRLNFCQWVDSASPWLSADTWTDCEDDIDINELIGEECYGGLDLSGTRDLTALGLYFPRIKTLLVEFWTPKDTLLDRERTDNVPYTAWLTQGFIHAPPGHAVDYSFVAERIADLSAQFDIKCIGFDQYRINYLEPVLVEANVYIPLVKHGQGYYKASESNLWMPRSIELFEKLITDKEIRIKVNPCLRWNAASAVLEADAKDNRIFTKKKSTGRIDGVVAAAMSVGTALESEGIDDDEDWLEAIRDPIYS
ncbi:phage terminase small subunit P27 family [Shewanella inventionis]|uniref:terminase large subunit n=1 Tax=Shewanella inventionis TaxID=1738770 RepID=UPI001CBD2302|nr:terminase TerL endonuclease subunit [Shewanella inventionis]UAL42129.1 phage terminase small subunit P27 family [Shewanella inventionis]